VAKIHTLNVLLIELDTVRADALSLYWQFAVMITNEGAGQFPLAPSGPERVVNLIIDRAD
jgi:hypothetical protein